MSDTKTGSQTAGKKHASSVQGDDINISLVVIVGALFAVLVFICIVGLQAWFYTYKDAEVASQTTTSATLLEQAAIQQGKISRYDWVDTNRTAVRLPIDRAMDLVVADMAKK